MKRVLGALVLVLAASGPAAAQTPPADVCRLFSTAEVAAALGGAPAGPGKTLLPGICTWGGAGVSFTIADTADQAPADAARMLDAVKARVHAPDTATDETGLGQRAVSTVDARAQTVELYVVSGSDLWRFTVEAGDRRLDAAAILPQLRKMAAKALKGKA